MRFSVLLLCIVLGIIAFVDASAVDIKAGDLSKRGNQCESNSDSPAPAPAPAKETSHSSKKKHANSGKATNKGQAIQHKKGSGNKNNNSTNTDTAAAATTTTAAAAQNTQVNQNNANQASSSAQDSGSTSTCLAANALQTGSFSNGQEANSSATQAPSQTSDNNFINICSGQTLTNGKQVITGSCNGIPLGPIPAKSNMPSSLITFPEHNQDIAENQTFTIAVTTINMQLGSFTNAQETYYSAPTELNSGGNIIGHTHVTVQDLGGSFTPTQPLDPTRFAFFLGINTAANAQGQVFATVPNGLPAGFYRVCTMVANSNHSPLQMPVAQRGAQDDCHYFSVGQTQGNSQATQNNSNASNAGSSSTTTSATASASASASTAAPAKAKQGKGKGGKGRRIRI